MSFAGRMHALKFSAGALVSVAGHVALWVTVTAAPIPAPVSHPPAVVRFEVVTPPPPPPPREAAPEPEPPTPPRPRPAAPKPTNVSPPPPAKAPEPTSDPEPAPLEASGLTLTGNGFSTFSALPGNGLGTEPPTRPEPKRPAGVAPKAAPPGPPTVPLAELSERPVPPDLNSVLARHYPVAARRQGLEGDALVRARIGSDGRVMRANVVTETGPGFGNACRETLLRSRWSPPKDGRGRSVATEVKYRCRFRVQG